MELLKELSKIIRPEEIYTDEPMKAYTTFRVGGPARIMVCPSDEAQVAAVTAICRETGTDYFVLGRGSNLLVSDSGYQGVVINLRKNFSGIETDTDAARITAQAGAGLPQIAQAAYAAGLGGLEFASGIPGTMGGGLYMNAGAYGGELKQVTVSARLLTKEGTILTAAAEELQLGYRHSRFMKSGEIVLSAVLQLTPRDPAAIKADMDDFNTRRREKQPLEYASAGSTFQRPAGHFAGKLIEDAGLKGYTVGGAQVSEKHAGFVINLGNASAQDIWQLCREVREIVLQKTGVALVLEVQCLGSFQ